MLDGSQDGSGDYFSGMASGSVRPSTDTPSHLLSNRNHNDFSPHFLAAAAAASAQAEAARAAGRLPSSSSSSSTLQPSSSISPAAPLPYLDQRTPFPVALGSRVVKSKQSQVSDRKGKAREGAEELGRVRCCWAVLSTRTEKLDFLYVDPTFSEHLGSEADRIKSTSFFDYIHSEEEERTRMDMKNIIGSRTLFGSVTRCRYSSLSQIKSMLKAGGPSKESARSSDGDYLPVDIVVNWIGDDMALCFFHAILDESLQDNDELHKTDWSNWCGMKDDCIDEKECQTIWQSIQSHRNLTSTTTGPQYVFQVLSAVPSQKANATTPKVLFSWPPPRFFASSTNNAGTASAINFADGSYFVDDFARLAQGVDQLTLRKELSDASTSCTRRFRAKHTLTTDAMVRSVESVLIPYGSIVLACFSVTYAEAMVVSSAVGESIHEAPSLTARRDSTQHYRNASASSLKSMLNASASAADGEPRNNGLTSGANGSHAGGSVATLAAVAAAASAQSKICISCGSNNSPEWRKGPDGTKSLCNACGLRFSRNVSRAKKKEERSKIAAEVAANGGIIPPHLLKKAAEEKKKAKRPKISKMKEDPEAGSLDNDQSRNVTQVAVGLS